MPADVAEAPAGVGSWVTGSAVIKQEEAVTWTLLNV